MYSVKQGKRDFLSNSKLIKGLFLMGAPSSAHLQEHQVQAWKNIG